jgi:hypothetical protein
MNLQDFMFPITERSVAINNGQNDISDWDNVSTFLTSDYKAIVREDTNEPISIVKNSYQVVPNETLINKLMHELVLIDTPFKIDPSHSFCENNRMRLQVTFPDLTLKDEESGIALSLFLHNSYDMSEGVRMFWGAIRAICANGCVFGKVLSQFYGRHTQGFQIANLRETLTATYDMIPAIQHRIDELRSMPVTDQVKVDLEKEVGKRMAKEVLPNADMLSQWQLYNALTHVISHSIEQRLRARYQMAVSRVFQL